MYHQYDTAPSHEQSGQAESQHWAGELEKDLHPYLTWWMTLWNRLDLVVEQVC